MREQIAEISHLSMRFNVGASGLTRLLTRKAPEIVHAIEDLSLTIYRGETLALVGESGCGKSTFARILAGLYRPSAGDVRLFGEDLTRPTKASRAKLSRRVNMIFQDPFASLNPRWTIKEIVSEPILTLEDRVPDLEKRVQKALDLVRMPVAALSKYPHQFSGGQRQRISIARALTTRPEFLILDEPTSALDVSVQAQVLNLMKEIQNETEMTYLLISHNLAVVHHMSDRVGVMYLGRLVELADKEELFTNPCHPYTQMLLRAIPDLNSEKSSQIQISGEVPSPLAPPPGCAFHPRCERVCAGCSKAVPQMREVVSGHQAACFEIKSEGL